MGKNGIKFNKKNSYLGISEVQYLITNQSNLFAVIERKLTISIKQF